MAWTTDALLSRVRLKAGRPASDAKFTDAVLLELADDVMLTSIAHAMRTARSEHWVTEADQSLVSGTAGYDIPSRALASGLRDVCWIDESGDEWSLDQVGGSQRWRYERKAGTTGWQDPAAFYTSGNTVVVLPTPQGVTSQSLRLRYYRRPNTLIVSASAEVVASFNAGVDVTVDSASVLGSNPTVDFIRAFPHFDSLGDDVVLSGPATNTYTSSGVPSTLTADDWVCPYGTSPVPQIPPAVWPYLEACLVAEAYDSDRDQGLPAQRAKVARMEAQLVDLLRPRVTGERKRVQRYGSQHRRRKWL